MRTLKRYTKSTYRAQDSNFCDFQYILNGSLVRIGRRRPQKSRSLLASHSINPSFSQNAIQSNAIDSCSNATVLLDPADVGVSAMEQEQESGVRRVLYDADGWKNSAMQLL